MTTHQPTSLPTAHRGGKRVVGSWMPASSLLGSSRRCGIGIAAAR